MAKVQILIAMTIDGFLPSSMNPLLDWVKMSRDGFTSWHEDCTFPLYPGYPLVDLICEKDTTSASCVYQAEICDETNVELLRGLSLYHLIDEMVIYLLPLVAGKGIHVAEHFISGCWKLYQSKSYKNGVCRMIYRKVLQ